MVGYSLNDTIIIFDRVRENLKKHKQETFEQILNRSINETLPRSVLTHGTSLSSLMALTIFGGEVIRPFALVMFFGVFTGTFSSIYIASPVLMAIEKRWPGSRRASPGADRAGAGKPRPWRGERREPRTAWREQRMSEGARRGPPPPCRSARSTAMLIDTHCHLADPAYDPDRTEVLARAWAAGVGRIVAIGECRAAAERALRARGGRASDRRDTAGIHPHDAAGWSEPRPMAPRSLAPTRGGRRRRDGARPPL